MQTVKKSNNTQTVHLKKKKRLSVALRKEERVAWIFILPAMAAFLLFRLIPFILNFVLSLTDFRGFGQINFVGLQNYAQMLTDSRLLTTYRNTAILSVGALTFNVGVGLILALLLNTSLPKPIRGFFRSVYFFPVIIPLAYAAIVWQYLLSRDIGIVNYYLSLLNLPRLAFLTDPPLAKASIIFVDVWKFSGMAMVIFLAGLQNIPREFYEAGLVDGTSRLQSIRYITLPLLTPVIFFNIITFGIGALQIFESIIIMTNGGPGDATRSIVMYIHERGFLNFHMAYASAIASTLFVIIMILTFVQFLGSRKWVHYR